jgi:hypothetical protein
MENFTAPPAFALASRRDYVFNCSTDFSEWHYIASNVLSAETKAADEITIASIYCVSLKVRPDMCCLIVDQYGTVACYNFPHRFLHFSSSRRSVIIHLSYNRHEELRRK